MLLSLPQKTLFHNSTNTYYQHLKTLLQNPATPNRGSGDFLQTAGGKRAAMEEQQNIRGMGLKGLVIVLQSLLRYGGLWQGVAPDIVDGGDMLGEESLGSADNIYRPSGMLVYLLRSASFAYYHLNSLI